MFSNDKLDVFLGGAEGQAMEDESSKRTGSSSMMEETTNENDLQVKNFYFKGGCGLNVKSVANGACNGLLTPLFTLE